MLSEPTRRSRSARRIVVVICYAATLGCYALLTLVMTLPQAILLWTEPDPEPETEFSPNPTLAGADR